MFEVRVRDPAKFSMKLFGGFSKFMLLKVVVGKTHATRSFKSSFCPTALHSMPVYRKPCTRLSHHAPKPESPGSTQMHVDVSDGAGLRSKSPGKGHRTPHELPHSHGETSVVMV